MDKIIISLQETIDLLPDGVLIIDEQGKILMANKQVEQLFGYEADEMAGQELNALLPLRYRLDHKTLFSDYFQRPGEKGKSPRKSLFGLRRDGTEFDVGISLIPALIEEQRLVIATVRDISEKKDLERALQWKNEQLEAINTELERFGFTISHDLKSPLANIQGIIHLITRELPEEKKDALREHIYHLNQTLYSMSELISGVAAYSKATLADTTGVVIDMADLMQEVRYLTLLPAHMTLEVAEDLPVTWGNKTKLLQVFLNLISNAIKYNDKEAGLVRVSGSQMGDKVLFCIEDNGPGIAPELRDKVFMLFDKGASIRTDSQGIGLAIVAKVLHELGGIIHIDQSPLGGARFQIELPVMKQTTTNGEISYHRQ